MLDCKTVGFFLKVSKEVGKAWRKSNTHEPHTPFSASFQTFCVTAHAYLNTPKSAFKVRCIKYSETNNKVDTL